MKVHASREGDLSRTSWNKSEMGVVSLPSNRAESDSEIGNKDIDVNDDDLSG